MAVLFISDDVDVHCNAMQWALRQVGVDSDIWSFGDFPLGHNSSIRVGPSSARLSVAIRDLEGVGNYSTVWNRRPNRPDSISDSLAAADREMSLYEAHLFIENLKPVLAPEAIWLNPHEARRRMLSKALQLQTAAEVGFAVPDTLLSNNFDDIRAFVRGNAGNVIYKSFHQAGWKDSTTGAEYRNFTNHVTEDHIENAVSVTSCPGIYQRLVPKRSELRVAFFGSTYYAMRIFSQDTERGQLDWRSDVAREARTEIATLGDTTLQKCREFVKKSGLLHGSIDLIEDPYGEVIFLEVNEMGQFLWLEDYHPELAMLATSIGFTLDPSSEFDATQHRLPGISMNRYRMSEMFRNWKIGWDEYVARGIYPQTYSE